MANPVLTEHQNLRFIVVFVLYVAQGLPVELFYFALPSWQAQNGASAAAVGGVLALTSLPWSLKLIKGIIMDRFAFLPMGRRRWWFAFALAQSFDIALGSPRDVCLTFPVPKCSPSSLNSCLTAHSLSPSFRKMAAAVRSRQYRSVR